MSFKYPVYRKLSSEKNYYKIMSINMFEEIQIVGKKYLISKFEAKIYPDKLRVEDMIELRINGITEVGEEDYNQFKLNCETNLDLISY